MGETNREQTETIDASRKEIEGLKPSTECFSKRMVKTLFNDQKKCLVKTKMTKEDFNARIQRFAISNKIKRAFFLRVRYSYLYARAFSQASRLNVWQKNTEK